MPATKTKPAESKTTNTGGKRIRDRIIGYAVCVEMANPNGEVDTGGPRVTSTGHNIMSPFSVKRKIRDLICRGDADPLIIDIAEGITADKRHVYESETRGYIELKPFEAAKKALALASEDPKAFLDRYFDARLFGAMAMSDLKNDDGDKYRSKFEGCVQVSFPSSIAKVTPYISSNSKKHPVREAHASKADINDLAPDGIQVIEHALLFGSMIVNGFQAGQNGATESDIDLLERLIPRMFDDRSAQRVGVHVVSAFSARPDGRTYFPSNQFHVLRAMRPSVKEGTDIPAGYDDYNFPTTEGLRQRFGGVEFVDLIK
jgi:Cas7 group CRISPR-associated protein Csh2